MKRAVNVAVKVQPGELERAIKQLKIKMSPIFRDSFQRSRFPNPKRRGREKALVAERKRLREELRRQAFFARQSDPKFYRKRGDGLLHRQATPRKAA